MTDGKDHRKNDQIIIRKLNDLESHYRRQDERLDMIIEREAEAREAINGQNRRLEHIEKQLEEVTPALGMFRTAKQRVIAYKILAGWTAAGLTMTAILMQIWDFIARR